MNNTQKLKTYGTRIFCWLVKGAGLAVLGLVLVIFIGEGPPNPFELTARELFLFVSLLATLVGLGLALWNQLVSGIVILVGIIPFAGERLLWLFWAFAAVGVCNILCWWLKKLQKQGG